ncbi:IstB-like ATP binding protein [Caprobacter fermentans]|uniref:IstB-like ATP binding protein n=1 Tax=Caproicibacter fermentans TaxID=2576756 RepID=A0A6N8HWP1_9FIRM|nr:ATP-binding protein [Caproicibacter fermentans]MVB10254.1 IstB-like ATP binding protein [Caproicibacter fermentans]
MILTGYDREVYEAAGRVLRERRRTAESQAEKRRAVFYSVCPEAEELERRLAKTAVLAAKAVLSGKNAKDQLERLHEENRSLRSRISDLLRSVNMKAEDLEPIYHCEKCRDTGYVDGRMCSCLKTLLKEEAYNRLNALTPLSLSTFEGFSLDYYPDQPEHGSGRSPRSAMREILQNCRKYAETFSIASSQNLIMQGATGLGKTHLSLAVANEVLRKGYGVVYCSVNNLISRLENEHFGREETGDTGSLLESCDLLILDDLGTEFRSSFSVAAIYNIVNTRLLLRRPTIISTNLSMRELQDRYSDRFASRIAGNYVRLMFLGHDNRMQKLLYQHTKK